MMICCFTGHRNIPPHDMMRLPERLDYEIEKLIICGVDVFRCGGAMGFDTLAALKVLEKRNKYNFVRLELILPCADQTNGWTQRNKDIYNYIRSKADSVELVADVYTPTCMHERNRRLVNGSDFCIAYLNSVRGGTAYTYNYARKLGVDVINLAEQDQDTI
ncbi:MAG: DUF1273 family protein [Clostridia bacterium]|nr:DUF1273 family protein [Clostridia bacterium]